MKIRLQPLNSNQHGTCYNVVREIPTLRKDNLVEIVTSINPPLVAEYTQQFVKNHLSKKEVS